MAIHGASSSSSSSSAPISRWDVFLSFRGEDTRKNFTAHLCATLRQKGIQTFMDDKLRSGEEISPELVKAIEESKISIIVLSKNYASSRWCLDELMKILDCRTRGQQVLPLFYDVTPSEVRHTTHTVGEAFAELEKWYKDDKKKVKGWKTALKEVADLSGKHLENYRDEPEFIREIIEWVNSILVKKTHFQIAQYPIRIESCVEDLKSLLDIEKNDGVCMVGIFGTGGIGKTTIAKAVYNSIASQFQCSCFLGNIRETSLQTGGMIRLQKELLSMILEDSSLMVNHVDEGITLIKKRLHNLRVLLVLDDVDKLDQLEKLAGKDDWFSLGSRIIITTRDTHVLTAHGIHLTYQVRELEENEALQLFSWHAFKRDKPNDDFVGLTKHAISYAGGLPLALVVLGSDLFGKNLREWKSALDRYKRIPNKEIQEILRISYDGLADTIKEIFLDIACFFNGEELGYVSKILDNCGFFPDDGIKVLVNKSLISIGEEYDVEDYDNYHEAHAEVYDKGFGNGCGHSIKSYKTLEMHDLLQEMGREIVRQESPKEPGKRSRLWFHKDVCHVLEGDTGTIKVEGILIDSPKKDGMFLNFEAFKKMKMLRLFINRNGFFFEEPTLLLNELKLIDWPQYHRNFFPSNIHGKNLAVLRMHRSIIKGLEGLQKFQNLTTMDFTCCIFLQKIPDVSMTPNLESLVLDYCKKLVEVHHSVGFLDKLVLLSARGCYNLSSFPTSLKLRSLESLLVSSCFNLKNFPEIKCQMKCLEFIHFSCTGIKELPSSIKYLVGIKMLNLGLCTKLMHLPDSIDQLQHLEFLNLRNCKQLQDILRLPPNVVEVHARWCKSLRIFLEEGRRSQLLNMWDPPEPVGVRTASPALQLSDLGNNVLKESEFSIQHNCPSSLKVLDLSYSAIVSLPTCFNRFVGLEKLKLKFCEQLRDILILPPNVVKVNARMCKSLAIFLEEPGRAASPALQSDFLIQRNCPSSLKVLDLSYSAIVSLPTCFNRFVGLEKLKLKFCEQLRDILILPPNVVKVNARMCKSLAIFLEEPGRAASPALQSDFLIQRNCPSSLKVLDLSYSAIVSLPTCFNRFVGLEKLNLEFCEQLRDILILPPNVVEVNARMCKSLAIFLEEPGRAASPALQSDFLIQRNCPSSLKVLDLSYSAIVSLPTCFNRFVGLEKLNLEFCEQLRDILILPPNVVEVNARMCKSLAIFLEEPGRAASPALQSDFLIQRNCPSSLKVLDLSYSAIVSLRTCFNRFVGFNLELCRQLRHILRLPPNVVEVQASGCTSLAIFLEEPRRAASPALQSDFLIPSDCPSSLEFLDLSGSAIVSLPAWLNKFVGLKYLHLIGCRQLREIPELPPNIKEVYLKGCTSLERFQFNNINDLPMLEWIDFTDCHGLFENMGDDLQIRLMSERQAKDHEFSCLFPGKKIPDCFNHHKEVQMLNRVK